MEYTYHAREKMREYSISEADIEKTIKAPEKLFLDVKTGRLIAIKKWIESKHLVVVYEADEPVTIVTAFPTSKVNKVVENRVKKGRWVEL